MFNIVMSIGQKVLDVTILFAVNVCWNLKHVPTVPAFFFSCYELLTTDLVCVVMVLRNRKHEISVCEIE